jgi:hypothetical protein
MIGRLDRPKPAARRAGGIGGTCTPEPGAGGATALAGGAPADISVVARATPPTARRHDEAFLQTNRQNENRRDIRTPPLQMLQLQAVGRARPVVQTTFA